jgi:murein DD-endopeptidase MepM/ murein hydrolase activator NlpD
MRKRYKLFYYSEDSVSYVEAEGYKVRFALWVIACVFLGLGVIFVINHYLGDVLGIDLNRLNQTMNENRFLKDEIKTLNSRLSELSATMDKLSDRDNQLRVAVNLPEEDEDTRSMGIGGVAVEDANFGILSKGASDLVTTSKEMLDKLQSEAKFQEESYKDIYRKSQSNKDYFSHIPAIKPMDGVFSYHSFGMRMHPILGRLLMHEGVDIVNEVGTPVHATGDGVVEFAGNTGGNYGIAVEINHGFNYKSWYAHLSKPLVHAGQKVKRGDVIALSGNTGLTTGPHLHYEVRYKGKAVNPVTYFIDDVDLDRIKAELARN